MERFRVDWFSSKGGYAWAGDRQEFLAPAGALLLWQEMLGQLRNLLGFPAQSARPEVIDDASHPGQLSRGHCSQILAFQQKQSRRAGLALQLAGQLRQVLLEQCGAPLERGQGLGRCQSEYEGKGRRKLGKLVARRGDHLRQPLVADPEAFLGQRVDRPLGESLIALSLADGDETAIAQALDRLVETCPLADVNYRVLAPSLHPALNRVRVQRTTAQHAEDRQVQRRGLERPFHGHDPSLLGST